MARILFVQKDPFLRLGLMILSNLLKEEGHTVDLFIEPAERRILKRVKEFHPHITGFSCTTGTEGWAVTLARKIKEECETLTLMGGPHPTFFPEIIHRDGVDVICRGEGEHALVELAEAVDNQKPFHEIQNLWAKNEGRTYQNPIRDLVEDLDSLPFPDFSLYEKYVSLNPYYINMYPIMATRGCPSSCAYCYNCLYRKMVRGKGNYLRRRSPGSLVREILTAKERHGVRKLLVEDDSFLSDEEWFKELHSLYLKEVNMPFTCQVEARTVTDERTRLLKEMGCINIRIGIETGDEKLRRGVLKKQVSTEELRRAARIVKANGINLQSFNMFGLPGEDQDHALKTYLLNRELGVDFVWTSLLQPYPGTEIYENVKKAKLFDPGKLAPKTAEFSIGSSYFDSSCIALKDRKAIVNLQRLSQFFVRFRFPLFLVRRIIHLPENPLFLLLFRLNFAYSFRKVNQIPWRAFLRMGKAARHFSRG
jgi:radical SAM superfamily enzyme YgiQ (UPF0313 family)